MCAGKSLFKTSLACCWQLLTCLLLLLLRCYCLSALLHEQNMFPPPPRPARTVQLSCGQPFRLVFAGGLVL
ncbi:hypothetical protein P167DRAFT_538591 [Morchella conica CCBAS932]|uniref:Secreted protein n=1 Tax=Morchella conica CCBAS932 TaxID=1392247 RepID=A0A3N4KFF8_9PEZI|nr:hypothetical protein P167DRAFT_538591 [Morchella conica CCBAS932]